MKDQSTFVVLSTVQTAEEEANEKPEVVMEYNKYTNSVVTQWSNVSKAMAIIIFCAASVMSEHDDHANLTYYVRYIK